LFEILFQDKRLENFKKEQVATRLKNEKGNYSQCVQITKKGNRCRVDRVKQARQLPQTTRCIELTGYCRTHLDEETKLQYTSTLSADELMEFLSGP
jgi:hypothetical protein